jgi:hypothetical protein
MVDMKEFVREGGRKTQLTPEQLVSTLLSLERRVAPPLDIRRLTRTEREALMRPQLTQMERRAISDAIRLGQIRLGMMKEVEQAS